MNRQVPKTKTTKPVAIIGNGKMARHMVRYFELLGQSYSHWFRQKGTISNSDNKSDLAHCKHPLPTAVNQPPSLESTVVDAEVVLLLIRDDQIEKFIIDNPILAKKACVHFSGSLTTQSAMGCHPLMTFAEELYELEQYQSVPFVVDEGIEFSQIFPMLQNSVYAIKSEHKALYHAFCVMAGNFSQMMWKMIGEELANINLPADLMHAYLLQNTKNFIQNPDKSATGPLARGDFQTIAEHQKALTGHCLSTMYQTFCDLYNQHIDITARTQA